MNRPAANLRIRNSLPAAASPVPTRDVQPLLLAHLTECKAAVYDHQRTGCRGCSVCVTIELSIQFAEGIRDPDRGANDAGDADQWEGLEACPGVIVRVTARDIAEGNTQSEFFCPIARAMRRATGRAWALLPGGAVLCDVPVEDEVTIPIPAAVKAALARMDAGETLRPFCFRWAVNLEALPEAQDIEDFE